MYSGLNFEDDLTFSQLHWETSKYKFRLERQLDSTIFAKYPKLTYKAKHDFEYLLIENILGNQIVWGFESKFIELAIYFSNPLYLSGNPLYLSVLPPPTTKILQHSNSLDIYFSSFVRRFCQTSQKGRTNTVFDYSLIFKHNLYYLFLTELSTRRQECF